MKFPRIIRHRKAEVTIYGKKPNYPFYRIAYRADGKRHLRTFAKYREAVEEAEKKVRDLANGSQAAGLTAKQSRDALAAIERLETLQRATGRAVSLLAAVSEFAEATAKANGRNLSELVTDFQATIASVKRKEVAEAVEEFIKLRKPLTEAKEGKRAQISKNYAYMVALWLRDFAKTFPATAVCDLAKEHLNLFMQKHASHAPKSRNHYRGAVKMFLTWCAKRDYLSSTHRLFEADSMATESADIQELDYYRPEELKAMLERAGKQPTPDALDFKLLLPVIALGGLAGLRLEETLRLEWSDIWRVAGHLEIKAMKAKTRTRRLVMVCPALAAWLEPYRASSGKIFGGSHEKFHETFGSLRESLKIPPRRNGLRHAFCTYHFALHANENQTAQQAGNSPAMIHQHYKGLATKDEAEKWFAVTPPKTDPAEAPTTPATTPVA